MHTHCIPIMRQRGFELRRALFGGPCAGFLFIEKLFVLNCVARSRLCVCVSECIVCK
jgi:hypothetical protein